MLSCNIQAVQSASLRKEGRYRGVPVVNHAKVKLTVHYDRWQIQETNPFSILKSTTMCQKSRVKESKNALKFAHAKTRPTRDSNPEPLAPKANALSIEPAGLIVAVPGRHINLNIFISLINHSLRSFIIYRRALARRTHLSRRTTDSRIQILGAGRGRLRCDIIKI